MVSDQKNTTSRLHANEFNRCLTQSSKQNLQHNVILEPIHITTIILHPSYLPTLDNTTEHTVAENGLVIVK